MNLEDPVSLAPFFLMPRKNKEYPSVLFQIVLICSGGPTQCTYALLSVEVALPCNILLIYQFPNLLVRRDTTCNYQGEQSLASHGPTPERVGYLLN